MNEQKLKKIEDYVADCDNVSLTALSTEFNISMSTLRRAVKVLCDRGTVNKRYGFVYTATSRKFIPFHLRTNLNTEGKIEACKHAAQFIKDGDIIYLDSGSTICYILDYIDHLKHLTVITGNIDIIIKALSLDNVTTFVLPGLLNKKNNSFTPTNAREALAPYNISKAFMAVSGLSLPYGFSHSDPLERETKLAAIQKSEEICFVLDESKFGHTALISLGPITMASVICSDSKPDDTIEQFCQEHHITLKYSLG